MEVKDIQSLKGDSGQIYMGERKKKKPRNITVTGISRAFIPQIFSEFLHSQMLSPPVPPCPPQLAPATPWDRPRSPWVPAPSATPAPVTVPANPAWPDPAATAASPATGASVPTAADPATAPVPATPAPATAAAVGEFLGPPPFPASPYPGIPGKALR